MKLNLIRFNATDAYTIGILTVNDVFECFTLEDTVRDLEGTNGSAKVHGKTAIMAGAYEIVLDRSARFDRILPRLLEVPYFEGIRIHSGNWAKNTEGCLLVGSSYDATNPNMIGKSALAMGKLMHKLMEAVNNDEVISIEVT